MNYQGPERRTYISFTREDSDRMVRMEQQLIDSGTKMDTLIDQLADTNTKIATQNSRIGKLEEYKSWITGIGMTLMFLVTCALGAVGIHVKH